MKTKVFFATMMSVLLMLASSSCRTSSAELPTTSAKGKVIVPRTAKTITEDELAYIQRTNSVAKFFQDRVKQNLSRYLPPESGNATRGEAAGLDETLFSKDDSSGDADQELSHDDVASVIQSAIDAALEQITNENQDVEFLDPDHVKALIEANNLILIGNSVVDGDVMAAYGNFSEDYSDIVVVAFPNLTELKAGAITDLGKKVRLAFPLSFITNGIMDPAAIQLGLDSEQVLVWDSIVNEEQTPVMVIDSDPNSRGYYIRDARKKTLANKYVSKSGNNIITVGIDAIDEDVTGSEFLYSVVTATNAAGQIEQATLHIGESHSFSQDMLGVKDCIYYYNSMYVPVADHLQAGKSEVVWNNENWIPPFHDVDVELEGFLDLQGPTNASWYGSYGGLVNAKSIKANDLVTIKENQHISVGERFEATNLTTVCNYAFSIGEKWCAFVVPRLQSILYDNTFDSRGEGRIDWEKSDFSSLEIANANAIGLGTGAATEEHYYDGTVTFPALESIIGFDSVHWLSDEVYRNRLPATMREVVMPRLTFACALPRAKVIHAPELKVLPHIPDAVEELYATNVVVVEDGAIWGNHVKELDFPKAEYLVGNRTLTGMTAPTSLTNVSLPSVRYVGDMPYASGSVYYGDGALLGWATSWVDYYVNFTNMFQVGKRLISRDVPLEPIPENVDNFAYLAKDTTINAPFLSFDGQVYRLKPEVCDGKSPIWAYPIGDLEVLDVIQEGIGGKENAFAKEVTSSGSGFFTLYPQASNYNQRVLSYVNYSMDPDCLYYVCSAKADGDFGEISGKYLYRYYSSGSLYVDQEGPVKLNDVTKYEYFMPAEKPSGCPEFYICMTNTESYILIEEGSNEAPPPRFAKAKWFNSLLDPGYYVACENLAVPAYSPVLIYDSSLSYPHYGIFRTTSSTDPLFLSAASELESQSTCILKSYYKYDSGKGEVVFGTASPSGIGPVAAVYPMMFEATSGFNGMFGQIKLLSLPKARDVDFIGMLYSCHTTYSYDYTEYNSSLTLTGYDYKVDKLLANGLFLEELLVPIAAISNFVAEVESHQDDDPDFITDLASTIHACYVKPNLHEIYVMGTSNEWMELEHHYDGLSYTEVESTTIEDMRVYSTGNLLEDIFPAETVYLVDLPTRTSGVQWDPKVYLVKVDGNLIRPELVENGYSMLPGWVMGSSIDVADIVKVDGGEEYDISALYFGATQKMFEKLVAEMDALEIELDPSEEAWNDLDPQQWSSTDFTSTYEQMWEESANVGGTNGYLDVPSLTNATLTCKAFHSQTSSATTYDTLMLELAEVDASLVWEVSLSDDILDEHCWEMHPSATKLVVYLRWRNHSLLHKQLRNGLGIKLRATRPASDPTGEKQVSTWRTFELSNSAPSTSDSVKVSYQGLGEKIALDEDLVVDLE